MPRSSRVRTLPLLAVCISVKINYNNIPIATFKIKLHEIKHRELPEVDDEFAKDVSEFDTLKELKASIKENLE